MTIKEAKEQLEELIMRVILPFEGKTAYRRFIAILESR